ncbi:NAD(P)-dependent oxidoreductase [Jiangella sp. DSM 45060]|uniref:NAD-dependent epimerase/dehydratase family protein n=1 Tax=Jiangella sp. DSM 45060 TaxID=1798224 RepID=UPI00087B2904|nr:NAD-dependent epimerase/dehydratase family protein [Jiangella sp. DSM 45060]SDT04543.1 Nucleoside-diphosphate-sugar epimerase [Jiangella sp. DSM 45060]
MRSIDELDERLSRPRPELVADLRRLDGDVVVLGASGKLGVSLVRLAVRGIEAAGTGARVFAVSRYGGAGAREAMEATGAQVVAADIADDEALAGLPDAANVVYLVGAKFGTEGNQAGTWETNVYLPGRVARRYAGSRISALSTGNVYPLTGVGSGGATEDTEPGPVGEYAMSCLGRERVLQAASQRDDTPMAIIRLNYAVEMRYGVLIDLAQTIDAGEPVDVTMGSLNLVWQGYANEVTLRALLHAATPPLLLNLTGPETLGVRRLAGDLAAALGKPVEFTGEEAATALLSNAQRCHALFGYPDVTVAELVEASAHWVREGLPTLGKPTKFQRRDGKF